MCAERQNHARELMKEYDLSTVDGIVIASGDGLLYEVQYYTVCLCPDPDPYDFTPGGEWYDGERGLGTGSQDTHWDAAHWLRECSVCLYTLRGWVRLH